MANTFDTSFIPQQPLLKVEGASPRAVSLNLPLMMALVVFFVSLMLAGGVYFFKIQADGLVTEKQEALVASEKNFSIAEIEELKKLESRIAIAKELVDQHAITSVIFDLIQARAAQNIGLTSLKYAITKEGVEVTLEADAPSYEAAYFQLETWRNTTEGIRGVEGDSYVLDDMVGIVSFTAKINIDPQYIQSAQVLKAQPNTTDGAASLDTSLTGTL